MLEGTYYLHRTEKKLIFKHKHYEYTGDLVEKIWPVDPSDRRGAWRILLEGAALGCRISQIEELATEWGCDEKDSKYLLEAFTLSPLETSGLEIMKKEVWRVETENEQ